MSLPLYHGTRSLNEIMATDAILNPLTGDLHVSLTTDINKALYWANMERDGGEYESAGVIMFTRSALLKAGHKLFLYDGTGQDDEAEIGCVDCITGVGSLASAIFRVEQNTDAPLSDFDLDDSTPLPELRELLK